MLPKLPKTKHISKNTKTPPNINLSESDTSIKTIAKTYRKVVNKKPILFFLVQTDGALYTEILFEGLFLIVESPLPCRKHAYIALLL